MAYYIEGYSTPSGKSRNEVDYGREYYREYAETREDRLKAEEKRRRNGFIHRSINTHEVSEFHINSNSPAEHNEAQKYKWPILNTKDPDRIRKEKRLHTLMADVDDLMRNVGLTDKKFDSTKFTYEVYMKGNEEMNNNARCTTHKRSVAPKRAGSPGSFKPTHAKTRKRAEQFDPFVDELVNILDDCDKF